MVECPKEVIGKVIDGITLMEDVLTITFQDGVALRIEDEGYQCCEHRYMTTDDSLDALEGQTLLKIEVKDGPKGQPGPDQDDDMDYTTQFLVISTSLDEIVMVNHNDHNGYYAGFDVTFKVMEDEDI